MDQKNSLIFKNGSQNKNKNQCLSLKKNKKNMTNKNQLNPKWVS